MNAYLTRLYDLRQEAKNRLTKFEQDRSLPQEHPEHLVRQETIRNRLNESMLNEQDEEAFYSDVKHLIGFINNQISEKESLILGAIKNDIVACETAISEYMYHHYEFKKP